MTEVRSFNCSNGNSLLLVKDGNYLTLNKLTEKGNWENVAEKQYVRPSNIYGYDVSILRMGFNSKGDVIRNSTIRKGSPYSYFEVVDGKTDIAGDLFASNGKIYRFFGPEMTVNLKTMGNLAKRYLKKAIEFCPKIR
jgi:hypothetical protein